MLRLCSPRLRRAERGATAIEYAIIAGLIGLGLVGSLVATRGSLSAIFGVAGSQMSSGTSASGGASVPLHPPVAVSPNAGAWAAKTIVSQTATNVSAAGGTYSFTFSDGSIVNYQNAYDANGNFAGESYSRLVPNQTLDYGIINASGQLTQITHQEYYSNGNVSQASSATGPNWIGDINGYTQQGSFSNRCNGCYAPSSSVRTSMMNDALYFRGYVNK